jgi:crooked neck
MEKTREVYSTCLKIIPHKKFTFAKMWLMFAKFEIRQKNLQNARKILVSHTFRHILLIFNY